MARSAATLDQLFDRSWRPRHPFRPRLSPFRRWGMFGVLCLLVAVISAYVFLTDSNRVRRMCESYLSQLSGGQVSVKHAALSIFEGLRLDGVAVKVDRGNAFDSTLFEAQTVLIKYDPESILSGKLEATQIIAIDPRVRLCENVDRHEWNYQRMKPPAAPAGAPPGPRKLPNLPEVSLRNGIIDYTQIQSGQTTSLGSLSLDGTLSPGELLGVYRFGLQSRGSIEGLGPSVTGQFNPATGAVDAALANFEFGRDVKAMLPDQIRRWLEDHKLAGRVNIPLFHIKPGENGGQPTFRVETQLDDVVLSVSPSEWLGSAETDRYGTLRGAFQLMRDAGLNGRTLMRESPIRPGKSSFTEPLVPQWNSGFVDHLESCVAPTPIELDVSSGKFVFTQDGIDILQVKGAVEGNRFVVNGHISGYSPSSPADITVEGRDIHIPENPRYVNSMPREVRELYEHMHPSGRGNLWVKLVRPLQGGRPQLAGAVNVEEGQFKLDQFPYPLRKIHGQISFGADPVNETRLDLNLSGFGAVGGPNQDRTLNIKGWIAPLSPDGAMSIKATAASVSSEKLVRAALPADAREALDHLDPSGKGDFPQFAGDLAVNLSREPGPDKPLYATITLDIADAKGAYDQFPYMLDHVTGKLIVGPGYVKFENAHGRHGNASVDINGRITFGKDKPITPNVHFDAHDVPVDAELLAALNPDQREWIQKLGVGGMVDFSGDVFLHKRPTSAVKPTSGAIAVDRDGKATTPPATQPSIDVTLDIALRNGTIRPRGSDFVMSDVAGKIRSADGKLLLSGFTGRRDDARLSGDGVVTMAGRNTRLALTAMAENLRLDEPLYQILPTDGQTAWDSVQPEGTLDAVLKYDSHAPTSASVVPPSDAPAPGVVGMGAGLSSPPVALSATKPATAPDFELTLRPRQLDATFKGVPYRLKGVSGTIFVHGSTVELKGIAAKHGDADIAINATGNTSGRSTWEMSLSGRNLPADGDLKKALPPAMTHLFDSMKTKGKFSFDFTKVMYVGPVETAQVPATTGPTTSAVTHTPAVPGEPDIDIAGNLWLIDASLDAGVPLTDVQALVALDAHMRNGRLAGLKGTVDASTLKIAGRPATNFHAEMFKPEQQDAMRIDKMRCTLAGGEMAGQIDVAFPETAPSRFAMTMVLRNADVRELAGEKENIKGQLTASLSLEGTWADATSRRGRGDVTVGGRDMYHIPLMLGLMQITNLSLPISSPFSEANARYMVDGQKVTFESIEMRASNMIMQGSGSLDFGTKKVRMTFTTDNPNWPKVPFVNDLIQGARHELFQIQVSGTVQEPRVKGSVFNTFSTTVDEVFRAGDGRSTPEPSAKRSR